LGKSSSNQSQSAKGCPLPSSARLDHGDEHLATAIEADASWNQLRSRLERRAFELNPKTASQEIQLLFGIGCAVLRCDGGGPEILLSREVS